ncbi:putative conjugative transfer protein TraA, partial [Rickettsia hoogstraalii str. RCCE3]
SDIRSKANSGKRDGILFCKIRDCSWFNVIGTSQCFKGRSYFRRIHNRLINDWNNSKFKLDERLIITMRNIEVDSINQGIRELLKAKGLLTGKEYRRYIA